MGVNNTNLVIEITKDNEILNRPVGSNLSINCCFEKDFTLNSDELDYVMSVIWNTLWQHEMDKIKIDPVYITLPTEPTITQVVKFNTKNKNYG